MFDSLIKLFEYKNLNQNMALRKQLKNVKIQNAEQLEVVEEEVCRSGDSHLEWPPRIMGFIHAKNVCQKEVIAFISTHKKRRRRWEQLKIKLSPFKEDPSGDEEYEELNSCHLDKNDDSMNEEDDKAE